MAAIESATLVRRTKIHGDLGLSLAVYDVVPNSSVAAGGDTFADSDFGMNQILYIAGLGSMREDADELFVVHVDWANKKFQYFGAGTAGQGLDEEVGDLNAAAFRVLVIGIPSS